MLDNFFRKLLPRRHREDIEQNLARASRSVSLTIDRYENYSQQIQNAIRENGFAKYLYIDKGEKHDD